MTTFSNPRIVFFDVKQGDSMLYTNQDFQLLVDGGPGDYLLQNIGKYVPFYDRKIEYVVLTHAHYDHYAGLVGILSNFDIGYVVLPNPPCSIDPLYNVFLDMVEEAGAKVVSELELKFSTFDITVKSNSIGSCVSNQVDVNNSSLITTIKENGLVIMNVGDLEATNEEDVSANDISVLKAGHHCSKTSTSSLLIENITPEVVICSYGKNMYGHPYLELLRRLKVEGVNVFSTFNEGNIILNINRKVIYNEKGNIIQRL